MHRLQSASGFQAYSFGIGFGESYATSANDIGAPHVQNDSTVCGGTPVTLNSSVPLNNAYWVAVSDPNTCLLYTSDAADERSSVDLGGRRIIKKKTHTT